jgi:hypothetical protein
MIRWSTSSITLGLLGVDVRESDRRGEQGMREQAVLDADAVIDQCAHR